MLGITVDPNGDINRTISVLVPRLTAAQINSAMSNRNRGASNPNQNDAATAPQANLDVSHNRRAVFVNNINRARAKCEAVEFQTMNLLQVQDRLTMLETNWNRFVTEHLNLVGGEGREENMQENSTLYEETEQTYFESCGFLRARIAALQPVAIDVPPAQPPEWRVEVQTADALGNITDTWGKFSGDYAHWHSFRDRFKAAVHENDKLKTIFKFQYLKAAVTGAAERAMGTWKMTEANYTKAWQRLCSVYEDDYLADQTLVRRLLHLPKLNRATNSGLRRIIDTVHESLNQLTNFIEIDQWDPIILFLVVDCLDTETYDAWETHRTREAPQAQQEEGAAGEIARLPSWQQFESFLELRARILVHAERRERKKNEVPPHGRESSANRNRNRAQFSGERTETKTSHGNAKRKQPDACRLCNKDHQIWKCDELLSKNLAGRKEIIAQLKLCRSCFRPGHSEQDCRHKPCFRCPHEQKHNTILCPTRETERLTNMLSVDKEDGPEKQRSKRHKGSANEKNR